VLLAAGQSSRLGTPKGLVAVGGRPWIEHQLDALEEAGVREVVVVLGADRGLYLSALPGLRQRASVAINEAPDRGPFSSLQVGLASVDAGCAVFVLPVDVPAAAPEVWRELAGALERRVAADAAVPSSGEGQGGHPVLLSSRLVARLRSLPSTSRLDHLLRGDDVDVSRVVTSDIRVGMNLNEPRDWARLPPEAVTHGARARNRRRPGDP
jgi:molybdenum cofactor cytidylyltransferase